MATKPEELSELGCLPLVRMQPEDPDQTDSPPYNGQGRWRAPLGLLGIFLHSRTVYFREWATKHTAQRFQQLGQNLARELNLEVAMGPSLEKVIEEDVDGKYETLKQVPAGMLPQWLRDNSYLRYANLALGREIDFLSLTDRVASGSYGSKEQYNDTLLLVYNRFTPEVSELRQLLVGMHPQNFMPGLPESEIYYRVASNTRYEFPSEKGHFRIRELDPRTGKFKTD